MLVKETVLEVAKSRMNSSGLNPFVLYQTKDGTCYLISFSFQSQSDKEYAVILGNLIAYMIQAESFSFVSEVWFKALSPKEKQPNIPISEMEDRIEGLLLVSQEREEGGFYIWETLRDDTGVVTGFKETDFGEEVKGPSGLMTRWLVVPQNGVVLPKGVTTPEELITFFAPAFSNPPILVRMDTTPHTIH